MELRIIKVENGYMVQEADLSQRGCLGKTWVARDPQDLARLILALTQ